MASKAYTDSKVNQKQPEKSELPKHKQLVQMLSFRVVPAYYKEIEKVANHKKMTVSKLIRTYIKEGMKRDKELTNQEDKDFRVD
jgi:predicted DNA-binding ribbon-helix-helix protein